MTPTKPIYLIATALIVALGAFILTWRFYGSLNGFSVAFPLIMIVMAVVLTIAGFRVRKRIKDNEIGQDRSQLHPLTVARLYVMGTSCAWFGAICGGSYVGIALYVFSNYSMLVAAKEDTPGVVLGVIGGVLVAVAGLWLEKSCSAPPPSDEDFDSGHVVWSS